ncbi:MAG: anti-sigma F factor [Ruminococcaceae bacterium]|nr:anti-sigma F factor [Oscillospiraceae bacterium]
MKKRVKGEINRFELKLPAISVNESVARAAVAVFCAQQDPTATELADIKCAVSEAVTNCIVHAYREKSGLCYITVCLLEGGTVRITVRDTGCGITDVKRAREPLFTTDAAGERSGMGFTVMENFMDRLLVRSCRGKGTTVTMIKRVGRQKEED